MTKKQQTITPKETEASTRDQTIHWGKVLKDDYITVPRYFLHLGRYDEELAEKLRPRHFRLILTLQARKFKNIQIRAYWAELANDLNEKPDTVRKWAYQLRDMGLLIITPKRKRDPESVKKYGYGYRNERNIFSLAPMIRQLRKAEENRQKIRKQNQKKRAEAQA